MLEKQSKKLFSFYKFTFILLLSFIILESHAHSLAGHKNDFYKVLEGVSGNNLEEIYKFISSGMDSENYKINPNSKKNGYSFVKEFRKKFGSLPVGNHRLIGHWGFEGAIPFNSEPYKSALAQYPKNEIVKLWQEYVNKVTEFVMKKTGLSKKQAKGLAGVIYNTHLLGDYTTTYIDPLPHPKYIADETLKSLHRLLGNNNSLVNKIKNEFAKVNKKSPRVEYANEIKKILYDNNIGENFHKTYSSFLTEKKITYNKTKTIIPKKVNIWIKNNLHHKTFIPKSNIKIFRAAKFVNTIPQQTIAEKHHIPPKNKNTNKNINAKNSKISSSAANVALVIGLTVIHDAVRGDVSIKTLQKAGINTAFAAGSDILFTTLASQSDDILKTSLKYSGQNSRHVAKLFKTGSKIASKSLPFVMDVVFVGKSIYDYNKGNISQNEMLSEIGVIALTSGIIYFGAQSGDWRICAGSILLAGAIDIVYILFMEKREKERIMNEMKWLAEKEQLSNDKYIQTLRDTLHNHSMNEENNAWLLLLQ